MRLYATTFSLYKEFFSVTRVTVQRMTILEFALSSTGTQEAILSDESEWCRYYTFRFLMPADTPNHGVRLRDLVFCCYDRHGQTGH